MISLLIIVSLNAKATIELPVTDLKTSYEKETIRFHSKSFRTGYVKDDKFCKFGWRMKNLKKELEDSPEALREFELYRINKNRGIVKVIVGEIVGVGAIGIGLASSIVAPPIGIACGIIGMGFMTFGCSDLVESNNHLQSAIWTHNRDVTK